MRIKTKVVPGYTRVHSLPMTIRNTCTDFLVSRNRPSAAIQLSGGTIGIVPRISSVSAVGGGSLYDQMQFEEQRQQRERNEKDNLALKLLYDMFA